MIDKWLWRRLFILIDEWLGVALMVYIRKHDPSMFWLVFCMWLLSVWIISYPTHWHLSIKEKEERERSLKINAAGSDKNLFS